MYRAVWRRRASCYLLGPVPRRFSSPAFLLVLGLGAALLLTWHLATQRADLLTDLLPADLGFLRSSRSLQAYTKDAYVLIEPSSAVCPSETPVAVLVTSAPGRVDHRQAIRETWARGQPTFFFLGISGASFDEDMVDVYTEAKGYGDMVVFNFKDTYHNLTVKTGLMLQWVQKRCPQAGFVMKTDDDVFVNPWTLRKVVAEHAEDQLVGYRHLNRWAHRNPYSKWYLPRWLFPRDVIPEYLCGTGYLINGKHIPAINEAAKTVPLINLEDIFFTLLVAVEKLGLALTHDRRLSPYQPLFSISCSYWELASMHSVRPPAMANIWAKVEIIANATEDVCFVYKNYLSSMTISF